MAVATAPSTTFLTKLKHNSSPGAGSSCCSIPTKNAPRILAMAPQKKVRSTSAAIRFIINLLLNSFFLNNNREEIARHRLREYIMMPVNKYDSVWKKQWFGAGLFYEGREEVDVDVFKKLEKRKVLSNVEKAGLLSKTEELGFTLSSIEKLGVFSKAEELGLLNLLEKVASSSSAALAYAAPSILVAVRAVVAGSLAIGATGLFVGSVVLEGLQDSD